MFLRTPSLRRRKAWRDAAGRLGGGYTPGRFGQPDVVQVGVADTVVTMDLLEGRLGRVSTRFRAPFVNDGGLLFVLDRAAPWSALRRRLGGGRRVRVGDPVLDRRYVFQTSRPEGLRRLVFEPAVQERLDALRAGRIRLEVADDEGPLGPDYAERVDVLQAVVPEALADTGRILRIFRLFEALLTALTIPPGEDAVARELRRLRTPRGRVGGRVELWNGTPIRHDALDRLAELADERAVGPLVAALNDEDHVVVAKAVRALGRIGGPEVVPELVRMLGVLDGPLVRKPGEEAADALVRLGRGDVVEAFCRTLKGEASALRAAAGEFRDAVVEAPDPGGLPRAVEGPDAGSTPEL